MAEMEREKSSKGVILNLRHHLDFLYANDVVLVSSSTVGLQRHLDALQAFCDAHDLKVNLGKTKVMIFSISQSTMHWEQFFFYGDSVEILGSYTYLGVLFSRPTFITCPTIQVRLNTSYASLARLERQCHLSHF